MKNYLNENFDEQFKNVPNLKYLPWVGKEYLKGFNNNKILVVAESVYNWEEDAESKKEVDEIINRNDFARIVAFEHGLYFKAEKPSLWDSKIARGIERAVFGKVDLSEDEKLCFWTSIVFHEFVQRPMSGRDEKPIKNDFKIGADVLFDIIHILEPNICLFFGTDYQKIKPISDKFGLELEYPWDAMNGGQPNAMNVFKHNPNVKTSFIFVKHPSSYFSWEQWHEYINDLIIEVNKIKKS